MKKDDNSGVSIKQIMITTLFLVVTVLGGVKTHRIICDEKVNTIQNIESASIETQVLETALVDNTEDDFVYSEKINFLSAKVIEASGEKIQYAESSRNQSKNAGDYNEKIISRGNFVREKVAEGIPEKTQNKLLNIVLNEIKELGDKQELITDIASGLSKEIEVSGEDITIENNDKNGSTAEKEEMTEEKITVEEPGNDEKNTLNPPTEYLKTIDVKATAYCLCKKCCGKSPSSPSYGVTASGLKIVPGNNMKVIAIDPKLIPLGSEVYVEGLYGANDYGYAIAADTGSAIKNLKIDLYMDTHQMALNWGVKTVRVYILEK